MQFTSLSEQPHVFIPAQVPPHLSELSAAHVANLYELTRRLGEPIDQGKNIKLDIAALHVRISSDPADLTIHVDGGAIKGTLGSYCVMLPGKHRLWVRTDVTAEDLEDFIELGLNKIVQ